MGNFRRDFETFSDDALINPLELAELLSTDRACLYADLRKGRVAKPVIHRQRQIRWRVGDIRDWLRKLGPAPALVREGSKRMGRKRKSTETLDSPMVASSIAKAKAE